jgi:DNA-directed RNA polymerase alpha subunit
MPCSLSGLKGSIRTGTAFQNIRIPSLSVERGLSILDRPVSGLAKSPAYPYGLTQDMINRLNDAGISTVGELAAADDATLDDIEYFGRAKIERIRAVVQQAIWM